jgi:hypothetical protein
LIAVGDEQMGAGQETGPTTTLYTRKLSRDEELQEERRKAAVRARYVSPSVTPILVSIWSFQVRTNPAFVAVA